MDGTIVIYLIAALVTVVTGYAIMRWIDFGFTKVEDKRRYSYAKGCIRCYNQGQKQMAMSTIKTLNNNLYEMYKDMSEL